MALEDLENVGIDKVLSTKDAGSPALSDVLLAFTVTNGLPQKGKHYTIQTLIDTLGKVATDAEAGAVEAKEAIELLKAAVEEAIETFNTKITADNEKWTQKVTDDLASLASTLEEALAAVGRTDSEGARGAAISAINALVASFDQKVTEANSTIDAKVTEATNQAGNAASSASAAAGSASAAATSETNAKNSETNAANSASASSTSAAAAKTSETNSKTSETNAAGSATAAKTSETNAKNSETAAATAKADAETAKAGAEAARDEAQEIANSVDAPALNSRMDEIEESIAAEADTREQADTNLQEAINTEVNDRTQGDANLQASIDLMKQRGGMMPGIIFPWVGPWDNRPARTLLCDGASYLQADYPDLFAAIGTKYNASTTPAGEFCVPDLTSKGYFIRSIKTPSATTAAVIDPLTGVKQEDAIRDISGTTGSINCNTSQAPMTGAFYTAKGDLGGSGGSHGGMSIGFDASRGDSSTNPTAGHTSTEVRPFCISFPFLISY